MANVLMDTRDHGLEPDVTGKVRDLFDLGETLLIVTTDRVSAYDVIMPDPVQGKGIILQQMTLGWYAFFGDDLKTHFITADVADSRLKPVHLGASKDRYTPKPDSRQSQIPACLKPVDAGSRQASLL